MWTVAGLLGAAALVVGAVTTGPRPNTAPGTRTALSDAQRRQRAQAAVTGAIDAALPTWSHQVLAVDPVPPLGALPRGWEATLSQRSVAGTSAPTLDVVVVDPASATRARAQTGPLPTCDSTGRDQGLLVVQCTSEVLGDGTHVDSGVLTDTFEVVEIGKNAQRVSVTAPFATATAPGGTTVSATAGVTDGPVPLTLGTTLAPGSPLTVAALRTLVLDARLRTLR